MMKTIGLIGGMSWESSVVYYKLINSKVREIFGGFHSCKSILFSVDFAEIQRLQHIEDWDSLDNIMADAAQKLEAAGADIIILCSNTMHLCSHAIRNNTNIPFLHIAEATGQKIEDSGLRKVALLGTKFTMEKDFYKTYLLKSFGIEVITPSAEEREHIHRIIYDELVQGEIKENSREIYRQIIHNLIQKGVEGVVLGCTEIPLLISQSDVNIPIFDTTRVHADMAVEWALNN